MSSASLALRYATLPKLSRAMFFFRVVNSTACLKGRYVNRNDEHIMSAARLQQETISRRVTEFYQFVRSPAGHERPLHQDNSKKPHSLKSAALCLTFCGVYCESQQVVFVEAQFPFGSPS